MIEKLTSILQNIVDVGIDDLVISPKNGTSHIRATNSDQITIVFFQTDMLLFDHTVAIQGANSFLSRLRLFDSDKVSIETEKRDDYISLLRFSQGRRKTSYRMGNPAHVYAPTSVPGLGDATNTITLTKLDVDKLLKEVGSISLTGKKDEQSISLSSVDGMLHYSIFNGEDDKFYDKFEDTGVDEFDNTVYDIKNFTRVLRKCIDTHKESVKITLTEMGALVFPMGEVDVILAPIRH